MEDRKMVSFIFVSSLLRVLGFLWKFTDLQCNRVTKISNSLKIMRGIGLPQHDIVATAFLPSKKEVACYEQFPFI